MLFFLVLLLGTMKNVNYLKFLAFLFLVTALVVSLGSCKPDDDPKPDPTAQEVSLQVKNTFNGNTIIRNIDTYTTPAGNDINLTRVGYLLSNIHLNKSDGSRVELEDTYIFMNSSESSFDLGEIEPGTYSSIGFSLGLNDELNHGDPNQYPVDHPLSPVNNNLHWSWQGGYIFIALEGNHISAEEGFVYHIAGSDNRIDYTLPASFTIDQDAKIIDLEMKLDEAFKNPSTFDMATDGYSSHSTTSTQTQSFVSNMADMFEVAGVR